MYGFEAAWCSVALCAPRILVCAVTMTVVVRYCFTSSLHFSPLATSDSFLRDGRTRRLVVVAVYAASGMAGADCPAVSGIYCWHFDARDWHGSSPLHLYSVKGDGIRACRPWVHSPI